MPKLRKLYLAIDNCFACKRWVKPMDWMLLIRDLGLTMVEQSTDTECLACRYTIAMTAHLA